MQDTKGYMWISSQDGINRYDGKEFFHFNDARFYENCEPVKYIYGITEDKNGDIWIGSVQGLYRYSQSSNTFKKFDIFSNEKEKTAVVFAAVNDEIWLFDYNCSFKAFNITTHRTRILAKVPGISLMVFHTHYMLPQVDAEKNIWFANKNVIYKINTATSNIKQFKFIKDDISSDSIIVTSISLHATKAVFGIATTKGLFLFNTIQEKIIKVNDPRNKVTSTPLWYIRAGKEFFFISSVTNGLLSVKADGSEIFPLVDNKVLDNENYTNKHTVCIYIDKWERLWLCSNGAYIAVIQVNNFFMQKVIRNKSNGLPFGTVAGIAGVGDKIWIADTYLSRVDNHTGIVEKIYSPSQLPGKPDGIEYLLYDSSRQRIWITATGKLYFYDIHLDKFIKTGFQVPDSYNYYSNMSTVRCLLQLENKNILIVCTNKVFQADNDGKSATEMKVFGENDAMKHMDRLPGSRFALSGGHQLKIFEVKGDKWKLVRSINFGYLVLMAAADPSGKMIWVATNGGVFKIDDKSYKILQWYNVATGMANDYVYASIPDKFGWVWCSTNRGIVGINSSNNEVRNFDMSQNLQDLEFNTCSFTADNQGYIYFGGVKGINYFKPPYKDNDTILPKLVVEEIDLNNEPFAPGINPDKISEIKYPYGYASFIKTQALHLRKTALLKVIYRLKGEQANWAEVNNDGYIQLINMSPGYHRLEIAYKESGNPRTDKLKIITIHVLPPWYKTWWAYVIYASVIAVIVYVSIKITINRKLQQQKMLLEKQQAIQSERLRISSELHDDLGSGLSSIRLISEMMKDASGDNTISSQLHKISDSSKELVQKMNEIVWALNINNDNLQSLLAYIRQYAVKALDDVGINCNVAVSEKVPAITIAGNERRMVFLMVKECIHNIIKHSKATQVMIEITLQENISIKIADNGIGFAPGENGVHHFGIINLKQRAKQLSGSIEWVQGNGTTVYIQIPLSSISHKSVTS
ncbi:MAG TPA: two-component regulator propeller domain-containing protein [Parafilimonas sp.]|nr:two-component regulator propeller domain-containing protein [Parafilimonas sp.]